MAPWTLSGTTQVSRYQKGKNQEGETNLDLLEQEIVSGNDTSWAIGKSALRSRQITIPASHLLLFLQAGCPSCCNQQRQSTEGNYITIFVHEVHNICRYDTN